MFMYCWIIFNNKITEKYNHNKITLYESLKLIHIELFYSYEHFPILYKAFFFIVTTTSIIFIPIYSLSNR